MSFAQLKKSFLIKDILDSDHERNGEHSCLTCSSSDCCPSNRASIWSSLLPHEHNGQSNWTSTTALYGSKDHGLYGLYCAAVAANCGLELEPQQNDQNLTTDCENSRKVRRNRTVFTELQLMGLERRFDSQKYLSTPDRAELARALGLTQLQVKTWYQNRRMKWKKQVMQNGCPIPPTKPKGRPKKNSIPSLGLLVDSSALLAVHALQQCNNKNTLHTGLHY